VIGQVAQFRWANEGEIRWVEKNNRPLSLQIGIVDRDKFAIVISRGIEWLDTGVNE
jgi:hypothetical protein